MPPVAHKDGDTNHNGNRGLAPEIVLPKGNRGLKTFGRIAPTLG